RFIPRFPKISTFLYVCLIVVIFYVYSYMYRKRFFLTEQSVTFNNYMHIIVMLQLDYNWAFLLKHFADLGLSMLDYRSIFYQLHGYASFIHSFHYTHSR